MSEKQQTVAQVPQFGPAVRTSRRTAERVLRYAYFFLTLTTNHLPLLFGTTVTGKLLDPQDNAITNGRAARAGLYDRRQRRRAAHPAPDLEFPGLRRHLCGQLERLPH